jgi:hypothetical protein
MNEKDPKNWITAAGLKNATNNDLYLTSFYFTITTITTVGYGDHSASTAGE